MIDFLLLFAILLIITKRPRTIHSLQEEISRYNIPELETIKYTLQDIITRKTLVEAKINIATSRIEAMRHV